MADSGAPGYPFYPRLVEITPSGEIAWEHRFASRSSAPLAAEPMTDGTILVTVRDKVFQLKKTGGEGFSITRRQLFPGEERDPFWGDPLQLVAARPLESGHIFVISQKIRGGGSVVEVTPAGRVVARFEGLERPVDALRLDDGGTLILDLGSYMVLDFAPSGEMRAARSYRAVISELSVLNQWRGFLLPSRHALISLSFTNNQSMVMEINDRLPTVLLNGVEIPLKGTPFMAESRLMVPMKEIFEALGASLTWDEETKGWTASRGDVSLPLSRPAGNTCWEAELTSGFPQIERGESICPFGLLRAFGLKCVG